MVTAEFKKAVAAVERRSGILRARNRGWILATGQEWAEVCFVPAWAARSKGAWLSFPGDSGVIRTEGLGDGSAATISHSELG